MANTKKKVFFSFFFRLQAQAQARTFLDNKHRRQANPGPTVHGSGPGEPGSGSQNQGTS